MVCSSIDTFQHFGGIYCPFVNVEDFYPEGRDNSSSKMLNVPNLMVPYPRWWWPHCLLPCEPYVSYAQNIYKSAITNLKVMQIFQSVFKEQILKNKQININIYIYIYNLCVCVYCTFLILITTIPAFVKCN